MTHVSVRRPQRGHRSGSRGDRGIAFATHVDEGLDPGVDEVRMGDRPQMAAFEGTGANVGKSAAEQRVD